MPVKFTSVESWEVRDILKKRGYSFHGNRAYGIQLSKPHPIERFKETGAPKMEILGGVSHEAYRAIMTRSDSPQHAADQIEAICCGTQMGPEFDDGPKGPKLDEALIERIVQNRAESVLAQVTKAKDEQIAELRRALEQMRDEQVEQKRKPGRPKGSKNKAKPGEPELTEEQEEMLRQVNFGPQL